jgi:hypothetical protein
MLHLQAEALFAEAPPTQVIAPRPGISFDPPLDQAAQAFASGPHLPAGEPGPTVEQLPGPEPGKVAPIVPPPPFGGQPAAQVAQHLGPVEPPAQPLLNDEDLQAAQSGALRGAKDGVLQRLALFGAWLPAGESDLGMADVTFEAVLGLPAPTRESPLLITPTVEMHYLEGPSATELPPRLYDISYQLRTLRPVTDRLAFDLAITPGWHGDLEGTRSDSFRLPARALAAWDCNPQLKLVLGFLYLDREDVTFLPAGGLIWNRDDDHSLELLFPRPRYWWRFACDECSEQWWYLGGELGGGSYAIRRTDGSDDIATLSDLRVVTGLQFKRFGGLTWSYDLAYVFAREVEFESAVPDFEPDDTAMLRLGVAW